MAFSPKDYCTHPLEYITELNSHNPSHCGTCQTPVAGKTFSCSACDSHLHPFCTTGEETLASGIHPEHRLTRFKRDNILNFMRHCAVCSEEIKGAWYMCSGGCEFDVHPQCSQLPCTVPHELVVGYKPKEMGRHEFALQLGEETICVTKCHVCRDRCGKWSYRCHACSVNVHFWCLLTRNDEHHGLTTTARGLGHHFDPLSNAQGQPHYYGVPIQHPPPPPPPPPYYAGGHQHQWGINQFHTPPYYAGGHQPQWGINQFHTPPYYYGGYQLQWSFNQFHTPYYERGHQPHTNWGGGEGCLYNHGGGTGTNEGSQRYNHNHDGGSSSSSAGRIMGKLARSLAVSIICDIVLKMIFGF